MSDDNNLARYLQHIAHVDLPLESKIELIGALRALMQSFVDRAFGDDSVQLARKGGDEMQITREARFQPVVSSGDQNKPGEKALSAAFGTPADRERQKEKR